MSETAAFPFTTEDLEAFRKCQRLSYDCVTHVESNLEEGMTEKEVCKMMDDYLREHGVEQYFHAPFAWFAERTAFANDGGSFGGGDFAPTDRKLEKGMPVILDVAPTEKGYTSDIGYAFVFGDNPEVEKMLDDLKPYRSLIVEGVKAGKTLQEIYRDVDALIDEQGYENRHRIYPGEVLGHRIERLGRDPEQVQPFGGFGPAALVFLLKESQAANQNPEHPRPIWNGGDPCNQKAAPGLYAVEPHIGKGPLGVKWEEVLVVTEDDAYWLDDDLPHVKRWDKN